MTGSVKTKIYLVAVASQVAEICLVVDACLMAEACLRWLTECGMKTKNTLEIIMHEASSCFRQDVYPMERNSTALWE